MGEHDLAIAFGRAGIVIPLPERDPLSGELRRKNAMRYVPDRGLRRKWRLSTSVVCACRIDQRDAALQTMPFPRPRFVDVVAALDYVDREGLSGTR